MFRKKGNQFLTNTINDIVSSGSKNLWLLLFFPVYLVSFFTMERLIGEADCYSVYCAIDDMIPFCEWFLFPYISWHALIPLLTLYLLCRDRDTYRNLMWYFIVTYTVTLIIYILWPSCHQLRPDVMPRDNLVSRAVALMYSMDTDTNVCPSMHITGALGFLAAAWHTKRFSTPIWRTVSAVIVAAIFASTLFLKQHSLLDVLTALPLSLMAYLLCFRQKRA